MHLREAGDYVKLSVSLERSKNFGLLQGASSGAIQKINFINPERQEVSDPLMAAVYHGMQM